MAPDDNSEADAKTAKPAATSKAKADEKKPTGKEHWGEGGTYRINSEGKRIAVSRTRDE